MLVSHSALRAARYQTLTPLQHVSTNCRLKDLPSGMVPKLGAKEVWLLCNFRNLALEQVLRWIHSTREYDRLPTETPIATEIHS